METVLLGWCYLFSRPAHPHTQHDGVFLGDPMQVHWRHAITGCGQCDSCVITHDLGLLSSSGLLLERPWALVQAAYVGGDLLGSLKPHYPLWCPLGLQDNSHADSIQLWNVAYFLSCLALPLSRNVSQAPVPQPHIRPTRQAVCFCTEANVQPGHRISASLPTSSPRVRGVVVGSWCELIQREGKGSTLQFLRILFEDMSSASSSHV